MEKIIVNLQSRSYPITIGTGLLKKVLNFFPFKLPEQTMIVSNNTIAPIYLANIVTLFKTNGILVDYIIIPDGEKYKNLHSVNYLISELLKKAHGRDTTLISLGGGVIGDLTGFAAASYQRGVRLIQVPTTLLSQVDSCVGGKTGVNHFQGKNMIGAFYQPASVLVDISCLNTLPKRELISGIAEVIKYGLAFDRIFFQWVEENIDNLLNLEEKSLVRCIRYCCELKTKIITSDEQEQSVRALLNLGHTFGHALERELGYGKWLHGEAVSAGLVIACRTAEKIGVLTRGITNRVISLLKRASLPVNIPHFLDPNILFNHMLRDKKIRSKKLQLVLPLSLGEAQLWNSIPYNIIISAIKESHQEFDSEQNQRKNKFFF
ncbi:MAG: 3-dehydroquinate synthase [Candidatus Dasytiphilus stammeri]